MSDLRDLLDGEARRVRARPEALAAVRRRADRRRRVRRIASGALALAIAAGGIGLAYAAFRPSEGARPAGTPVPGPTPTSDDETPAPLRVRLLNGSRVETLVNSTTARLQSEGLLERRGGYVVVEDGFASEVRGSTAIICPPQWDQEAAQLQRWLVPGAEIHGAIPNDRYEITVILGQDFAQRNKDQTLAYALITDFLDRRSRGSGAEALLSAEASRQFEEGPGGLSLYGYTSAPGTTSTLNALWRNRDGWRVVVRIEREGSTRVRHESLRIAPSPGADSGYPGDLAIVSAERND
jgi:hypothetical protein